MDHGKRRSSMVRLLGPWCKLAVIYLTKAIVLSPEITNRHIFPSAHAVSWRLIYKRMFQHDQLSVVAGPDWHKKNSINFGDDIGSNIVELSFNSTRPLVGSWLFYLQNFPCVVSFWCMRGGSVEV